MSIDGLDIKKQELFALDTCQSFTRWLVSRNSRELGVIVKETSGGYRAAPVYHRGAPPSRTFRGKRAAALWLDRSSRS